VWRGKLQAGRGKRAGAPVTVDSTRPEQLRQRERKSGYHVLLVETLAGREDSGWAIGVAHDRSPFGRFHHPNQACGGEEVPRRMPVRLLY
jgi:hypothetical protein